MVSSSLWRRLAALWLCALLLGCGDQALGAVAKAKKPEPDAGKPAVAGLQGRRAFEELGAFYRDKNKEPNYQEALRDLGAADRATRQRAGAYLLALLKQSLADERSDRPKSVNPQPSQRGEPWRIRSHLATAFEKEATGAEALEVALWLIENTDLPQGLPPLLRVLRRIRVPQSAAAFRKLLAEPLPPQSVAAGVIEEAAKRGLRELAPDVLRLCTHHRTKIRQAARAAAPKLGITNVPPFKPEEAFTPGLDRQLRRIAAMVLTEIPDRAKWVQVKYIRVRTGDKAMWGELGGWLLSETERECRVLTWRGDPCQFEKANTKVQPSTLRDAARALLAAREKLKALGPQEPPTMVRTGSSAARNEMPSWTCSVAPLHSAAPAR